MGEFPLIQVRVFSERVLGLALFDGFSLGFPCLDVTVSFVFRSWHRFPCRG